MFFKFIILLHPILIFSQTQSKSMTLASPTLFLKIEASSHRNFGCKSDGGGFHVVVMAGCNVQSEDSGVEKEKKRYKKDVMLLKLKITMTTLKLFTFSLTI